MISRGGGGRALLGVFSKFLVEPNSLPLYWFLSHIHKNPFLPTPPHLSLWQIWSMTGRKIYALFLFPYFTLIFHEREIAYNKIVGYQIQQNQ